MTRLHEFTDKTLARPALKIRRVITTCKCMRVDGDPRSLGPSITEAHENK